MWIDVSGELIKHTQGTEWIPLPTPSLPDYLHHEELESSAQAIGVAQSDKTPFYENML